MFHVLNCMSRCPDAGLSVILNTTWYGCSFTLAQSVFQWKTILAWLVGLEDWKSLGTGNDISARLGSILNNCENASIFTGSESGSNPKMSCLISVPASTQMSWGTISSGR